MVGQKKPTKGQMAITNVREKSIPHGLQKKPGGMPPGQYKKAWEMARTLDMAQAAYQMYLDPEGLLKSTRYSQNLVEIEHDHQKAQRDYLRNIALTAKGFHYAKIPHPLMTHFMR